MQHDQASATHQQPVILAYVEDSHNIGCVVRLFGETSTRRAHFSSAIQQHGVVIRAGNIVVVDTSRDPVEIIWRTGILGTIERATAQEVTVNLGNRTLTIPLRDDRPAEERTPALATGDRVLLRGSPIKQAAITDLLIGTELAHPDRLRASVERSLAQRASQHAS